MTRTFLVAIELTGEDETAIAEDIKDVLLEDGFNVSSVHPWTAPSQQPISNPWSPPDNGSPPVL